MLGHPINQHFLKFQITVNDLENKSNLECGKNKDYVAENKNVT